MSRPDFSFSARAIPQADQTEVGVEGSRFKMDKKPQASQQALIRALYATIWVLFGVLHGLAPAVASDPLRLVILGDSLTAGLGVPPTKAFPAQLEARLKGEGIAVEVINAGVSGDTTAAGLERLDWAVPPDTDAVIVELGANDALRGINPAEAARNLESIVSKLKDRQLPVLVVGMRAPANWGQDYQKKFDQIFADVAGRHGALLMPFFLEGVAMQPKLNQADGIHPNADGVARIVDAILPLARDLLVRAGQRRSSRR